MNAAELIEYIRTAEKKTPVKVYIWERFPTSFPNARVFPAGDGTKIVFGDWRDIGPAVRAQQDGLGGECVVSFAEHGRTNGERLAFGRLGGKRAVFDDGEHFNDRDTGQQFLAHETHTSLSMRARENEAHPSALRPISHGVVMGRVKKRQSPWLARKGGAAPE